MLDRLHKPSNYLDELMSHLTKGRMLRRSPVERCLTPSRDILHVGQCHPFKLARLARADPIEPRFESIR